MIALSAGLLAACFVLAVANGIRMIRDDGTGHMACLLYTSRCV